jgi:hypothetical protein
VSDTQKTESTIKTRHRLPRRTPTRPGTFITKDAAGYLGVSERTLERWRVVGGGPVFLKLGRRYVLYTVDALDAFLFATARTSTGELVTAPTGRTARKMARG